MAELRESERKRLEELILEFERTCPETCTGLEKSCTQCVLEQKIDHLLDNGIGVKPHCEAGEIVYLAIESPKPQIKTKAIESIVIGILDDKIVFTDGTCFTIWHKDWNLYNNAVFLTREEALAKLKGGESDA